LNPVYFTARKLRLASGLVLLTYVLTHLLNHSAGLVSLAAAEAGREVFVAFWRSPPATAAFYGALLLHFGLALAALYERRSLRMPLLELVRIALGFLIPLLLARHFVQTRVLHDFVGIDDTYSRAVTLIWNGGSALDQMTLLAVAWLHGLLGIHFAFRHKAAYTRWMPALVGVGTLVPLLAATGFLAMARELAVHPARITEVDAAGEALLAAAATWALWVPQGLLAAVLAARALRNVVLRHRRGLIRITYPSTVAAVPAGYSVLEASREFGIPHLSLCGGRARCSTCRIRVESSAAPLPAPGPDEARTLERIRAGGDVRLACQLRPVGDLRVEPLLVPRAPLAGAADWGAPAEREIVVLFADLRGWTSISERQLPFDLVYVLDRYFEAIGDAVREAGGIPNQFIGDSVMALFGLERGADAGARESLRAAEHIEHRMAELNESLQKEFGGQLDFGIGIHAGTAAVGTVGYRETRTLSAVGDAVNTASRLQELTKVVGARIVVSAELLRRAGRGTEGWEAHDIDVRGRQERLRVFAARRVPMEQAQR
jgi:adenylate cyclase